MIGSVAGQKVPTRRPRTGTEPASSVPTAPVEAAESMRTVVPPPAVYGRQRRGRSLVDSTGHNIPTFTPRSGSARPEFDETEEPTLADRPLFDPDFEPRFADDFEDAPQLALRDLEADAVATIIPPSPDPAPAFATPTGPNAPSMAMRRDAPTGGVHYVRPRRTTPGAQPELPAHTPRYQRNLQVARAQLRNQRPVQSDVENVGDRFLLRHLIGSGASSETHLAWDRLGDRFIALKLFRHGSGVGDAAAEFLTTAGAVRAIRHPNLVEVIDAGVWNDRAWLATEILDGETLQERLDRIVRPMPLSDAVDVAAQVAAALAALHRNNLVHGDLKAANVFLLRNGGLRVMDAGMPRRIASCHSGRPDGLLVGTPGWLSPERIRGLTAGDAPSDLFSLGVVLYQLFAHRRPFEGGSTGAILAATVRHRPPTPLRYRMELPPQLENLTLKCLAPDPKRRPQSARAAASVLQHFTTLELLDPAAPGFE